MPKLTDLQRRGEDLIEKAINAENMDNDVEAYGYYLLGIENLENCGNKELQEDIDEYRERAEEIKEFLSTAVKNTGEASESGGGGATESASKVKHGHADDIETEKKKLHDRLEGAVLTEKPNVRWDAVAGLEGAKASLKEAVIWPIRFPQLFTGKRTPWKGILLYGPPGTGKSYLAKAVATETDSKFFSVSSSDLVSKWQGDSEKLVRTLFEMARESERAIIFIDEIDSMVTSRTESESDGSRRIKTEFLVQMDGVGHNNNNVLVLGATNLPWQLDNAIKRRFEKRIYIPLPDRKALVQLFQLHLGATPCTLKPDDFNQLAEKTAIDRYTGSDISTVVRDVIMQPLRKVLNSEFFKEGTDATGARGLTPCLSSDRAARAMVDIKPSDTFLLPPIERADFDKSLKAVRPTVTQADIDQYDAWTQEFGVNGLYSSNLEGRDDSASKESRHTTRSLLPNLRSERARAPRGSN